MFQPLSTDLYLPTLPGIARAFDASPADVQWTLSLFIAAFGLWQLVAGPLSDRHGRRPLIVAGAAIYLAASLACMAAPDIAVLSAGRIGQAIGACTCLVGARGMVRDLYTPVEGAHLLASAATLMSLAPLFGPLVGAALYSAFGWRSAFGALAVFAVAMLLFTVLRLRETHSARDASVHWRATLARYASVARSPAFRAYTASAAATYAGLFAFISGSSFVLMRVHGLTPTQFAFAFASMVAGYLTGTLICRRLVRSGLQRTIRIGCTLQLAAGLALALAALAGWHTAAAIIAPMVVFGMSHGIVQPPSQAGAVAPFPHAAGAAAALLGFLMMVCAAAVGLWIGVTYNGTVYPLTLTIAATALLSWIIAITWVRRDGDVSRHG